MSSARNRETDYERWSDPQNIHSNWESRTQRAADFVPANSRVIEFGAATRILERHLDSSCTYVPSDIVDRGPGTFVCDFNKRPLPDLPAYDVAVIMGVLEYIHDLPEVVDWLAKHFPRIVVSYACSVAKPDSLRARYEAFTRARSGWMNNDTREQFSSLFLSRGYQCLHEENWKKQTMFVFSRETGA